jgi:hypothetical protein
MSERKNIGILGAGNVGASLGINLARHGYPVRFGVKPGKDIADVLAKAGHGAQAGPVAEVAAWADVLFLAVDTAAAVSVVQEAGDLAGKVLVDCTNPLSFGKGRLYAPPAEGSVAEAIAKAVPSLRVVKGFNTFGAEFHLDPRLGDTGADVYLASDDAAAKELVADIARTAGFVPVDVGPLSNAGLCEAVAALWVHLAFRGGKGRNFAFKLIERR